MELPKVNELPAFVYGLKGIRDLFGVSTTTAQVYKKTWLAPAITQVGKRIVINVQQAIECFSAESLREYRKKHNGDIGIVDGGGE